MDTTTTMKKALPSPPRKGWELRAHPNGQWYRQHAGRRYYFGTWENWRAAEEDYNRRWPFIITGQGDPADRQDQAAVEITFEELGEGFAHTLLSKLKVFAISEAHYGNAIADVKWLGDFADSAGKPFRRRVARELMPADWQRLRLSLEGEYGPDGVQRKVGTLRSISNYAKDAHGFELNFGDRMQPVTKAERRESRRSAEKTRGPKLFPREQLRPILDECDMPLDAMYLLALNCGFTAADCSALRMADVNLDAGTVEMARVKTGVYRFAYLWPMTVEALRLAIAHRPKVSESALAAAVACWQARKPAEGREALRRWELAKPDWSALLFLTRCGQPWVRHKKSGIVRADGTRADVHQDQVALMMGRALLGCDDRYPEGLGGWAFKRAGINFATGRHTYYTAARPIDEEAARFVMGHADDTMGEWYTHLDDEKKQRLLRLSNQLGDKLFGSAHTSRTAGNVFRLRLAGDGAVAAAG